jgi:hypothetical protein
LPVDVPLRGLYGENIKHTCMHTVLGISDAVCEYYKCMGGSVVMAIPAALGTALPYGRMYVD